MEHDDDSGATRVRASSLPTAFDCAYRWEGEVLLGIKKPSSPRAHLGSGFHCGTATFDSARMAGTPISVADGADSVVDYLQDKACEVDWHVDDLTPKRVEAIALSLYSTYSLEWSPRFNFVAVEMTIEPLLIDCGDSKIMLTGTLDRMRLHTVPGSSMKRVADLKSGARAISADGKVTTGRHRPQIGTYELLAENTLGEPIDTTSEVIAASTSGKLPIAMAEVKGSRELLLGTEDGPPGLLELLSHNLKAGRFPPNTSSPLCSPKYCARWDSCPYHE